MRATRSRGNILGPDLNCGNGTSAIVGRVFRVFQSQMDLHDAIVLHLSHFQMHVLVLKSVSDFRDFPGQVVDQPAKGLEVELLGIRFEVEAVHEVI